MTFAKKIFIAVFVSTSVLGTILIWSGYRYTVRRSEKEFISRYEVFTKTLGNTLTHLDTNTETLMLNAAKVVVERDEKRGLLTLESLDQLKSELGITHLFVIDKTGKFIRSTNDDTERIPNLFSFCEDYKKLVTGESASEATPIIKPNPEPKPYKFLLLPNHNRSRIVEVGVRVDFIAKTLTEAIKSDQNIESMSLYAPDGSPFGKYSQQKVIFNEKKVALPSSLSKPEIEKNFVRFFTKVESAHPRCCQCDKAGTSKDGEYYYVLENKVSKAELEALLAKASVLFMLVSFGNCVLAWILAKLLSRRLVRHIETAVSRVGKIKKQGSFTDRILLESSDEISFLTKEFDRLLDSLEVSQNKLIEAEKIHSKIELARIVAHNIKSPALAIEMMIPGLVTVPERMKRVLKNAVVEIKQLTENLKTQADSMTNESKQELDTDLVFLPIFLDDLVQQKTLEFSSRKNTSVLFQSKTLDCNLFVKASSLELRTVISNIINNAFESYGAMGGEIFVVLDLFSSNCLIKVIDSGAGIPNDYLRDLGSKKISFKGKSGRGLGLTQAFNVIAKFGGQIKISSTVGSGTSVEIHLPQYRSEVFEGLDKKYLSCESPS